eukprot:scaffold21081_cov20-Prasinocladus_malaysianus.AAC.1
MAHGHTRARNLQNGYGTSRGYEYSYDHDDRTIKGLFDLVRVRAQVSTTCTGYGVALLVRVATN